MHKKLLFSIFSICIFTFLFSNLINAQTACNNWSTLYTGSLVGQCTWYVHGRVALDAWFLHYVGHPGKAFEWWNSGNSNYVLNARPGYKGLSGDVMVFNVWNGNPYGHVAYVINSYTQADNTKAWLVHHANWTDDCGQWVVPVTGDPKEPQCDLTAVGFPPIKQCTFVETSPGSGMVHIQNGNTFCSSSYPVSGFLYKPIPGDLNGDGKVDIFDYNIIISNFGRTNDCNNPADTDGDCNVTIFDYSTIISNFGMHE